MRNLHLAGFLPFLCLAACGGSTEDAATDDAASMSGTPAPAGQANTASGMVGGDGTTEMEPSMDPGNGGEPEPIDVSVGVPARPGATEPGPPGNPEPTPAAPEPSGEPEPSAASEPETSTDPGISEPEPGMSTEPGTGEPEPGMTSEPEPGMTSEPEPGMTSEPEPEPATGPCTGLSCGAACDHSGGVQRLVAGRPMQGAPVPATGYCDAEGLCGLSVPVCEDMGTDCTETCPVILICQLCDDGETCATPRVACSEDGGCGETTWTCPEDSDPGPGPGNGCECAIPEICELCDDGQTCATAIPTCNSDGSCDIAWSCPKNEPDPVDAECPDLCFVPTICQVCNNGDCASPIVSCESDGSCGAVEWSCDNAGE